MVLKNPILECEVALKGLLSRKSNLFRCLRNRLKMDDLSQLWDILFSWNAQYMDSPVLPKTVKLCCLNLFNVDYGQYIKRIIDFFCFAHVDTRWFDKACIALDARRCRHETRLLENRIRWQRVQEWTRITQTSYGALSKRKIKRFQQQQRTMMLSTVWPHRVYWCGSIWDATHCSSCTWQSLKQRARISRTTFEASSRAALDETHSRDRIVLPYHNK